MQIFRLDPIPERANERDWEATYLREPCWVMADNEDLARLYVEGATLKMVTPEHSKPIVYSPWRNDRLTICKVEKSEIKKLTDKNILAVSGKVYPKLP